jgi:integrase
MEINELWRLMKISLMVSFLDLFRKYIQHHETAADVFEKRKPGTIRSYNAKYSLINEFLYERSLVHIRAENFDIRVSKDLAQWLIEKNYNHSYIVRVRHICKSVLQYGAENYHIKTNPLSFLRLRKAPPKPPPYLSTEEIQMLVDYIPKTERAVKAKKMAIIQLHTAFDIGDFMELKREHKRFFNGMDFIIKPRNKNGNEQVIPLTIPLSEILEELDYNIKLLGDQKYNDALKLIFKDLGFSINANSKSMRKIALGNKLNNEGWTIDMTALFAGHKTSATTEKFYVQRKINLISNGLKMLQSQTKLELA